MPFTNKPWDAAAVKRNLDEADYCRCCLIDLNEGDKIKGKCKLPVRATPGGAYNLNAMSAAAGALAGARTPLDAPPDEKRKAARKLISLYRQADRELPASLKRIAGARQQG